VNRRGQGGVLTLIFFDIVFFVLWALVLGEQLAYWGAQGAAQTTGLEAFLFSSLNFWVFIGVLLANLAFFAFAGGNQ
jgi:hypothetical protein